MAIQEMSLPQDLAWKRLAACTDMMDIDPNDSKLPPRWKSSLAIFYAEAGETDAYCDRIITYLKVACTITGFQVGDQELGYEFEPPSLGRPDISRQIQQTFTMTSESQPRTKAKWYSPIKKARNMGKPPVVHKVYELTQNQRLSSSGQDIIKNIKILQGALRSTPVVSTGARHFTIELKPEVGPFIAELNYGITMEQESWGSKVIDNYQTTVGSYRPCHGAMLQVSVYPGKQDGSVALENYPYFVAFEPMKRELYETVTESGEKTSASGSNVNVRKGSTTTNQTENSDVLTGVNVSTEFTYAGTGGGAEVGVTGEWGTRQRSGTENVNVTTTDTSREKRESLSHSTSISQLYTLLQSYHLATNRSLFLLLPRPHQKNQFFTFANGLRELEGIQEFFFVLSRPKSVKGLCVSAILETAHVIDEERTRVVGEERYGILDPPVVQHFDKSWSGKGWAEFTIDVSLPGGYVLDRTQGVDQGVTLDWHDHAYENFPSTVEVSRQDQGIQLIIRMYDDENEDDPTRAWGFVIVWGKTEQPIETPTEESWTESDLVLTGRRVSGCVTDTGLPQPMSEEENETGAGHNEVEGNVPVNNNNDPDFNTTGSGGTADEFDETGTSQSPSNHDAASNDNMNGDPCSQPGREPIGEEDNANVDRWLTYETSIPLVHDRLADSRIGNRMRVANLMIHRIGRAMIESIGSSNRYPLGKRRIGQATYISRELARAVSRLSDDDPTNVPLEEIKGISGKTAEYLKQMKVKNLADIARNIRVIEKVAKSPEVSQVLHRIILNASGLKERRPG